MNGGIRILTAAAVLALAVPGLVLAGSGAGGASAGAETATPAPIGETATPASIGETATPAYVETGEPRPLDATTVVLTGELLATDGSFAVWFEYRPTGDEQWSRTRPLNRSGPAEFHANATDLRPATGYEFRAVAATSDGRHAGAIRPFKTPPNGSSAGVGVTGTPTPMPIVDSSTPRERSTGFTTRPPEAGPPDGGVTDATEGDDWLAGWAGLLALLVGVPLAGGVVLGGLVAGLWFYRRGTGDG